MIEAELDRISQLELQTKLLKRHYMRQRKIISKHKATINTMHDTIFYLRAQLMNVCECNCKKEGIK